MRPHVPAIRSGERVPALDGLRAIAVLLVMLFHFESKPWMPGGFLGVDLFFVLSGFLITALLCREWSESGRVNLGAFYLRRAVRLLPAHLALLAGALAVLLLAPTHVVGTTALERFPGTAGFGLAYVLNWKVAFSTRYSAGLGHLWSLSVEEQYYLVWPAFLLLSFRSRRLGSSAFALCASLALLSCFIPLVAERVFDAEWRRIYFGTDTRAHALLAGSVFGFAHAQSLVPVRVLRHRLVRPLFAVLCLSLGAFTAVARDKSLQLLTVELPVLSFGFGLLVFLCAALPDGLARRALTLRPLVYVGRRSYALYLWHMPVGFWFRSLSPALHVPVSVLVSGLLAELSWRLIEQPASRAAPTFLDNVRKLVARRGGWGSNRSTHGNADRPPA